jgi:hypothetical protein
MFVHRQRDHAHLLAEIAKPLAHCHHALGQCANPWGWSIGFCPLPGLYGYLERFCSKFYGS